MCQPTNNENNELSNNIVLNTFQDSTNGRLLSPELMLIRQNTLREILDEFANDPERQLLEIQEHERRTRELNNIVYNNMMLLRYNRQIVQLTRINNQN